MEYLRIENDFPRISHSAVTLGKFDGIHRGHQKLVEKIIEQKQEGAQAVVLALGTASRTILTKEERCRVLEEMGVDVLLGVSAYREDAAHESREFYKRNIDRGPSGLLCGGWRRFSLWL